MVPGIAALRDAAIENIQRNYAKWLYAWAQESGALGLATWEGNMSWWWFAAISERSSLRGKLILRLYELLLARAVLRANPSARTTWYCDSQTMRAAIFKLLAAEGRSADVVVVGAPSGRVTGFTLLVRGAAAALRDFVRVVISRIAGRVPVQPAPDILFLTRFPVLWEEAGGDWRERMFGRLPHVFAAAGLRVAYAAVLTGNPLRLLTDRGMYRAVRDMRIFLLPRFLRFADVTVHISNALFARRFRAWRRGLVGTTAPFDGIELIDLLADDIEDSLRDADLAGGRLTARAMQRLAAKIPGLRTVLHSFEYQPFERAAYVGAKAGGPVTMIGLGAGAYASPQLGFLPNVAELRIGDSPSDPRLSPFPDLVVANGRYLAERYIAALGAERVLPSLALRYGPLAERIGSGPSRAAVRAGLKLQDGVRALLVACPVNPEEVWPLVNGVLRVASARPDIFLMFKFHYHLRLDREVAVLAEAAAPGRWRIFESGLHDLIVASDGVATGGSSVALESLALNRPTFVYQPRAQWLTSPAAETPHAFFFWQTPVELETLLERTFSGDISVSAGAREEALEAQFVLDVDGEEKLLDAMRRNGILPDAN
jgi:hypothetical protein